MQPAGNRLVKIRLQNRAAQTVSSEVRERKKTIINTYAEEYMNKETNKCITCSAYIMYGGSPIVGHATTWTYG